MKKLIILLAMITFLFSDTIYFKNGATIKGKVTQENAQTVSIKVGETTTIYSMNDINKVEKAAKVSAPPPPPSTAAAPSPSQATTIPAGTVIHIAMLQTLSTQSHKNGAKFKAKLESDLAINGTVIAKKGSDVYGVVVDSKQAGRLAGSSSMIIELTALSINNQQVSISTNKLNALTEDKQARNTVGKIARGAAIGGLIDGSDGAKDGAKVGAGLAVLTKGKATGIPAGTLLDFTITTNINISK